MCTEESGIELLTRLTLNRSGCDIKELEPTLFPRGLQLYDILELSGGASSGKTMMLTHLIKRVILLDTYKGNVIGGLNSSVVFLDTDMHFDVGVLAEMLKNDIKDIDLLTCKDIEEIVKLSLHNLILIRCYDSSQLVLSIQTLSELIYSNPKVIFLAVDSIAANYWQDVAIGGTRIMNKYKQNILQLIQKYTRHFKIIIAFTKPDYFESLKYDVYNQLTTYKIKLCQDLHTPGSFKATVISTKPPDFGKCHQFSIQNYRIIWY